MGAADVSLLHDPDACKAVVAQYTKEATRFNVTDLRVLDVRPAVHRIPVTIRHELEVISEASERIGMHEPAPGDFSCANGAIYQEQVTLQAQSEFMHPEIVEDLVHRVKQDYAAISARTRLRTHPRRLYHSESCCECRGAGKTKCGHCLGRGEVKCKSCHGGGRAPCVHCRGSGYVKEFMQPYTDANGQIQGQSREYQCSFCSRGWVDCPNCGGTRLMPCGGCEGCGKLTCTKCSGEGYQTKFTTTHTDTTPSFGSQIPQGTPAYVDSALSKVGLANLARYGRMTFQNVSVVREQSAVEFVYMCAIPFCELTVEINGIKSNWILFGIEPQILDAGGVLDTLLERDVEDLAGVAKSDARRLPWFYRSAMKAVAPFMASEVNQEVIEASAEGLATPAIVERVNRSVSEAYIAASLMHLKTTVRTAANWSRLTWLVSFVLLAIPFALGALAYLERAHRRDLVEPAARLWINLPGPSGFLWEMGWLTVPFTGFGWLVAQWFSTRWLEKAGGKRAVAWARRSGLLMGKWTAMAIVVTVFFSTSAFFNRWPVWIDAAGKAYGLLAIF